MTELPAPSSRAKILDILWNLLLIIIGSILCALSINGILIPHQFISGGITGIVLIINSIVKDIPFAPLYLLFNIPLYIFAYRAVGKRFFIYSVVGLIAFTAAASFVKVHIPLEETILAALFGGILFGAGTGIILRSYGSSGGSDILSIILLKRFSVNLGNTIMAVNIVVITLVGFLFSLEAVIYTLIYMFVSSRIVNMVVTGLSQRKAVHIISREWQKISEEILSNIRRGVTIIEGHGGYSRQPEHILYTVITFREIGQLKRIINQIDPNAFVVVSDTLEVMNYRIGNQPHW
ncbi:MAG: YitT family protein [Desulfobulbaceae bacterium]|nr:YitT family protein [Desulfobulbaceae bacterium]